MKISEMWVRESGWPKRSTQWAHFNAMKTPCPLKFKDQCCDHACYLSIWASRPCSIYGIGIMTKNVSLWYIRIGVRSSSVFLKHASSSKESCIQRCLIYSKCRVRSKFVTEFMIFVICLIITFWIVEISPPLYVQPRVYLILLTIG